LAGFKMAKTGKLAGFKMAKTGKSAGFKLAGFKSANLSWP